MAALRFLLIAAGLASALAIPPATRTPTETDSKRAAINERIKVAETECGAKYPSPRGPEVALCHTLCLFRNFGALDKDGRYVERELADLLWVVGRLTPEKSRTVANACSSRGLTEQMAAGCERSKQVGLCVTEETIKVAFSDFMRDS